VKGPQSYIPVNAALAQMVDFRPGDRAKCVKQSIDICENKGVLGAGYIPKAYQTTGLANSEGLFAYYQYAEKRTPSTGRRRSRVTICVVKALFADACRRRQFSFRDGTRRAHS